MPKSTLLTLLLLVTTANANQQLGLRPPDGFEISLYADQDLANDIYSLTVDSLGRVVVSSRGYVRILIDTDNDGTADTFKQFADGPDTGAQGLCFIGRDLLCTGDQGLLRYTDRNADDRADGPPKLLLKAKAGGEHDLHAVRQGPDGYLYLMAGNMAGIDAKIASPYTSPVKKPLSGTLLRLSPSILSGRKSRFPRNEILAHGFRNAYDFDFNSLGDIFTYDSDGERDVSLPWYRPTRVFHVLPGTHAGWFSRHWKRPHYFFDMPPVVAAFGRGSPTGVVCYRHQQFPKKYQDALFVLDWTYGRVMALPLTPDGNIYKSEPENFITAIGQHGFAPTDAAVGPDGSLFISVGGRGTRGSVYRIRYQDENQPPEPTDDLTRCLAAPQPLSSWSRSRWEPLAEELGPAPIREAALDEQRPLNQRLRAVEILTEKFRTMLPPTIAKLIDRTEVKEKDKSQELHDKTQLRARLAWAVGRLRPQSNVQSLRKQLLQDDNPLVLRFALESLVGKPAMFHSQFKATLAKLYTTPDPQVQQTLARVLAGIEEASISPHQAALRTNLLTKALQTTEHSPRHARRALELLQSESPPSLKLDAVRAAQIILGDVGPAEGVVPVFESYTSRAKTESNPQTLNALAKLLNQSFPAEEKTLNHELGRLIAMLAPPSTEIFAKVLQQISDTSHPVDDIHHLIILARLPVERTTQQTSTIAQAVVALENKIESASLPRDSNWDDRIGEMLAAHITLDPNLPDAILQLPNLGAPGHTPLVKSFSGDQLEQAVQLFLSRINDDPNYRLTPDVVRLLGRSQQPEIKTLLRTHADQFAIRTTILSILAEHPDTQDRPLFIAGLDTDDVGILSELITALESLPPTTDPSEIVTLVRTLRRLTANSEQRRLQDRLVKLLRQATQQSFDYQFDLPSSNQQTAAVNAWSNWAESNYPEQWQQQAPPPSLTDEQLDALLSNVDWNAGDPQHGKILFEKRSCAQCHNGRSSLGPDLAGVTTRFSRRDLFQAIFNPHRDVSPRYQTTLLQTDDGRTHTGRIIYGSVDGLVFRTSTNQTLRINSSEIIEERPLKTSLMPIGLLNDLPPEHLADLYAYLQTLGSN